LPRDDEMRALLLSTLVLSSTGLTSPPLQRRMDESRGTTRRALTGALIPALFLGATSAEAAFPGEIRKADQSAIGVSRVAVPSQGEGAKGAGIPSVPLDTSGWKAESVWGVNGAKPSANGFWAGGESQKEKDALMNREAEDPWSRMLDGRTPAGAPALTTPS